MLASFVWMQLHQTKRVKSAATEQRSAAPSAASGPFAVVILDPGHGGEDSGAMCGGLLEKDLTLDVARRIDRLLDSEGIATLMTRLGDTYVSLADRAAFANRITNCIFVSIHFNEDNKPVASGVETYYASHQITSSSSLASWLPFVWRPLSNSPNPASAGSPHAGDQSRHPTRTIFCDRKRDFPCRVNRRRIPHQQRGHFQTCE